MSTEAQHETAPPALRRCQVSIHIGAEEGQIAPTVLLPGDPLRAKHIAETMLEDAFCYNEVRGMLGYTGRYGGKRVSVMGSGMGIPTLSIYVNELVTEYQVKTLIRVGTCGALQPHLKVGDVVLAMTASTDSHINRLRFGGMDYAPAASFDLLLKAHEAARERGIRVHVGGMFSGDSFYNYDPEWWKIWAAHGALVCEMETNGLYTLAAQLKVDALSVLTVSDSLVTGESSTAEQREKGFTQMAEIALEVAP
jgi:purine-nucleoside phosphorylase